MTRHAASRSLRAGSRALLRAGLVIGAAGAALGAGGAGASAAEPVQAARAAGIPTPLGDLDGASAVGALTGAVRDATAGGLAPAKNLQLDPLAGTGVDPLDNSLGTQIGDFKPVTTAVATGPLAQGASAADLPLVGHAAGLLPG
ncbi:hypothetical protein [Streptomyces sp. NPDC005898]|uniref:hypothetical protein n=1 Tax=unclassified Streptomyces TaxID=2593676 RepID=UPI0033FB7732